MADFLRAAFAFPTGFFSVLLAAVLVYWLAVIAGALELELMDGIDLDADGDAPGLLALLGLGGVPAGVSLSLLVLFSWFLTFAGTLLLGRLLPGHERGWLTGGALGLGAFAGSVALTAFCARPLRRAFASRSAPLSREFLGRMCHVTTQRVDERFGQAEVAGEPIVIQVRCAEGNALTRGDRALIFDYDPIQAVFLVSPLEGDEGRKRR
jgi:hypothetical protein